MATDVPAGIPKTKRPSGPDITLHGDQKIPLLITGVQTTTGKYNGREGRVLLGHIPDQGGLGGDPQIVPPIQCTPIASHK